MNSYLSNFKMPNNIDFRQTYCTGAAQYSAMEESSKCLNSSARTEGFVSLE